MTTFIAFVIGLMVMEALAKLYTLYKGEFPQRTPIEYAIDIVFGVALIVWGSVLLARGA